MIERALLDPDWKKKYKDKVRTRERALEKIQRGSRIFIGSACGEPQHLVEGLAKSRTATDSEIVHILTLGAAPYTEERFSSRFRHNAFFIADNTRAAVAEGRADYTPVYLSELPWLIKSKKIRIDVALVQVSPPDKHGFVSLGVSIDVTRVAVSAAQLVIAEVNENMPRTHGYSFVHVSEIDILVDHTSPMITYESPEPDDTAQRMGKIVAKLVEDGSTIQIGIGLLPSAVVPALAEKNDLGVHTEMFSDWLIQLTEKGVINNKHKSINIGKTVASFCMGSNKLYEYIDNNPAVAFHTSEYINDPYIISQNRKMVSVNTALQVDLTGQVCSDSIGHHFYSGIGGQVDFVRGASRSDGGKAIICLASTTKKAGESTIVASLSEGAGVVTTRGTVRYIVTEWGYADLHGKSIRERAMALISIAHPDHREKLLEEAKELKYVYPDQILPTLREYPEDLESTGTHNGVKVRFRPVLPVDESLMKDFFYSLSEETVYLRYFALVHLMPHARLQENLDLDYETKLSIAATRINKGAEEVIGLGEYGLDPSTNMAETSVVIRDEWQEKGIGKRLLSLVVEAARRRGLNGATGFILPQNRRMLHLYLALGFTATYDRTEEAYTVKLVFDK